MWRERAGAVRVVKRSIVMLVLSMVHNWCDRFGAQFRAAREARVKQDVRRVVSAEVTVAASGGMLTNSSRQTMTTR
jgi:hypothetical protein